VELRQAGAREAGAQVQRVHVARHQIRELAVKQREREAHADE
jgi:hypothetical protein